MLVPWFLLGESTLWLQGRLSRYASDDLLLSVGACTMWGARSTRLTKGLAAIDRIQLRGATASVNSPSDARPCVWDLLLLCCLNPNPRWHSTALGQLLFGLDPAHACNLQLTASNEGASTIGVATVCMGYSPIPQALGLVLAAPICS